MTQKTYKASCKCGNLGYELTTTLLPQNWFVRRCSCEYCQLRPDHVHFADPKGTVNFTVKDHGKLFRETHETDADFLLCKECGGYMGAIMRSKLGNFAVLNVEHLHDDLNLPTPDTFDYGEEDDMEVKYARRHKNWMPFTGDV